ncbi:MAG: methylmalonyl-CoA mutase family protein [bacterium]|nr:methylmalonyl-CoA mutase family protein [bacterium]
MSIDEPGKYPFKAGIYPKMHKDKKPTVRLFAGMGTARHTNARFKKILSLGGTGLSTAYDLPTLYGDDSDAKLSRHEVGWDGVAIDTIDDEYSLYEGIPIDKVTVSKTINASAAVEMAMYIGIAEKRGICPSQLGGTIQNDIYSEHFAQNEILFPLKHGLRLGVDLMEYCARHMPKWYFTSLKGYQPREAGCSAALEVALPIESGIGYARKLLERGLKFEQFAPRFSFFFDSHNNGMEEIAKYRAARWLWAEITHKFFGMPIPTNYNLKDPKLQSMWCRMHVQTAGCTLQRNEPMNNIMRIAYQALWAILGGVQSIHTNAYDELFCVPTEKGVKIAIRTQQVLLEETGITNFPDAFGGAVALERETEKIYEEAKREVANIENMGGIEAAIKAAYPQRKIHENAIKEIAKLEQWKADTDKQYFFTKDENLDDEIADIVAELESRRGFEKEQLARLRKFKKNRSETAVQNALDSVRLAAERKDNLMPTLIAAVKTATMGEIHNALCEVWGGPDAMPSVSSRMSRDKALEMTGGYKFPKTVRVLLAKGGHDGHTVGFYALQDIFQTMGAEVVYLGFRATPETIAKAAAEEDVNLVGLSAMIGYVPGFFEDLQRCLKAVGRGDIEIIGGGIMLPSDEKMIKEKLGIKNIYVPGSSDFATIISNLKEKFGQ